MAFQYITQPDLDVYIRPEVLDQISDGSAANQETAELDALAKIRSYLSSRYKIDEEFAKTGTDRNRNTVKCACIFTIYTLYISVSTHQVPEEIGRYYDECTKWLDMARKGDIDPGLEIIDDIDQTWDGILNSENDFESYF